MKHWTDQYPSACKAGLDEARKYDTPQAWWDATQRGDWMLWFWSQHIGEPMSDSRRPLVLATAECARIELPIFESRYPGDRAARHAIETAERWGRGEVVTVDELKSAAAGRYVAAAGHYVAASVAAASAYTYYVAAHAAASVSFRCAEIVRRHSPVVPGGVACSV
jgi:hypothetical protein